MERYYRKSTADFYTLIFLISLSIGTIVLDYKYQQITYIRSIINDLIVYPIDRISNLPSLFINELIRESSDIKSLELKLDTLEKENISLKIQLQELNLLKDENIRLRKISKASNITSKKQTIVKVINNTASPNKRVVAIDKGEKHKIYVGQNVIGVNGLVGQVIDTTFLSSKVILITDPSHTIPAVVNRTGANILVSGHSNDGKLVVPYAEMNIDILKGDIISTSGLAERFKANIPIGTVVNKISNRDKKFSEIEIKPYEKIGQMSELILIWDYKPKVDINE
ncbi:MAG: rod shape-determining protein MreC [Gammaproteobacteria bacterium]|jgi:rod shape-determining protein MreC|nr:rod shape-determining protein MreC [Gammaproteobacteria bacterium]MBT4462600.1 rod shape-determining protein MreC [Gammaproteobacteria bacterium]MBT4654847.1 rod shape-determining protein MreC [Gammaproteobacteria bacterium]MBT5116653.1 rod shape-determining protein MreC [Gammaproteobacteria bacterium]MBT5761720.1 rod shape-determining protein MreC [Gammaproteobacteria bacterium]